MSTAKMVWMQWNVNIGKEQKENYSGTDCEYFDTKGKNELIFGVEGSQSCLQKVLNIDSSTFLELFITISCFFHMANVVLLHMYVFDVYLLMYM